MTKKQIALKHGFINGNSIHSSLEKIEEKFYEAMEEYKNQELALLQQKHEEEMKEYSHYRSKKRQTNTG